MKNKYAHLRILSETVQPLRMIHALTGESILDIVDRLANAELKKLQNEKNPEVQAVQIEKESAS